MSDAVVHEQLATEPTVPAHLEDNAVNGVTADVSAEEASGTTTEPTITQSEIIAEPTNVASGDSAAAEAAVGTKAAQVTSAAVDGDTQTSTSKAPIEASIPAETTAEADPLVEDVEAASAASDAESRVDGSGRMTATLFRPTWSTLSAQVPHKTVLPQWKRFVSL